MQLLPDADLPAGWRYPRPFLRLVDRGLIYLEPWYVLTGGQLRAELNRLRAADPSRTLVPFARREDRGDVACWDAGSAAHGQRVLILRSETNGERRQSDPPPPAEVVTLPDIYAWIVLAIADMLAYDVALV